MDKKKIAGIIGAFTATSGGAALKVTAMYKVNDDATETLLWSV